MSEHTCPARWPAVTEAGSQSFEDCYYISIVYIQDAHPDETLLFIQAWKLVLHCTSLYILVAKTGPSVKKKKKRHKHSDSPVQGPVPR